MRQTPLYRRVNTTAHGVHHNHGGDYRSERGSKQSAQDGALRQSMGGTRRRGLDYTPLFRFLLSKVGSPWDAVHAEAIGRLDRAEPLFWLVALHPQHCRDYLRIGESSYYSGLYVDAAGLLQRVNPALDASSLEPLCSCCTHTFNGVRFTRRYRPAQP